MRNLLRRHLRRLERYSAITATGGNQLLAGGHMWQWRVSTRGTWSRPHRPWATRRTPPQRRQNPAADDVPGAIWRGRFKEFFADDLALPRERHAVFTAPPPHILASVRLGILRARASSVGSSEGPVTRRIPLARGVPSVGQHDTSGPAERFTGRSAEGVAARPGKLLPNAVERRCRHRRDEAVMTLYSARSSDSNASRLLCRSPVTTPLHRCFHVALSDAAGAGKAPVLAHPGPSLRMFQDD